MWGQHISIFEPADYFQMDSNIGETPGVSDVSGLEGNKFLTSEYLYCSNTLGTESSVELPRMKVFSDDENF